MAGATRHPPGRCRSATPRPRSRARIRAGPRRPQRLATAVAEDLVDRIVGGELPVGSALPIEPVLSRRALESHMAGQAAVNADEDQLRRLRTVLERAHAEEDDAARFLRADLDFHYAVMAASGNRLGRAVIQTINTQAFHSLRYIGVPSHADCQDSNVGHQAVLDRIAAKDEQGAAAMNDHILRSWLRRRPRDSSRPDGHE